MALSSLNRFLSEPTARDRDLFEKEFVDEVEHDLQEEAPTIFQDYGNDMVAKIIHVHKNTNQKMIVVTQDKTVLCLKRNIARIGKKEWVAPLSTVMTLLMSLATANFKYAMGLSADTWKAIFIVSAFIATGWLARALHKSMHSKGFHEVIADIVYELGGRRRLDVR